MKEYFVATDDAGRVVTLEAVGDFSEELEECDCCPIDCDKCEQLEAALLAIIQGLREEIGMLKARVSDLEKKPSSETITYPIYPYINDDPQPWTVTYTVNPEKH